MGRRAEARRARAARTRCRCKRTTDGSEAWEWEEVELFRRAWSRAQAAGRVGGWRLRRDPEPLIGPECIVVPDFVVQRGNVSYALCLANGRTMAESLMHDLAQFGARPPAIVVLADTVALQLRSCPVPIAAYPDQAADAIPQIINLLEHDRRQARAAGLRTAARAREATCCLSSARFASLPHSLRPLLLFPWHSYCRITMNIEPVSLGRLLYVGRWYTITACTDRICCKETQAGRARRSALTARGIFCRQQRATHGSNT
ncbi:hypothetical protein HC891_12720 [Candidatus Gracilibacteria bacterium]|nr:hypothetical protein [Candidatus Gracilibacteria bacterium]